MDGLGVGVGAGLGVALGVGIGLGPGLGDGAALGIGLRPGAAVVVGGVAPGDGDPKATELTTWRVAEAGHFEAQQILTTWSPAPMSSGIVMSVLTLPVALAWNG
ncbi:MAG TPA: hypothetical protein VGU71_16175, partial [Candidatus Dormibacteraeota bacterium]|nr:hypothetical protein [Candidatus Dormibacteraeota bacterium]